ncbi:MAG: hypothetical protein HC849_28710 [Oscillatoriales cyanobacterium RU_3_3]|nr:hypothetical protein [Oscillatoriales cyanobacterium RU_3_3]NJR24299.1 hypothetical protein [Richelia sp. CSU_2_1]
MVIGNWRIGNSISNNQLLFLPSATLGPFPTIFVLYPSPLTHYLFPPQRSTNFLGFASPVTYYSIADRTEKTYIWLPASQYGNSFYNKID